jgi:antitoxin PrlF
MPTALTSKGQVTIPKHIREALNLSAGSAVDFSVNPQGEVVVQNVSVKKSKTKPDRFEAARGKADVKWRTDDLMCLLRG